MDATMEGEKATERVPKVTREGTSRPKRCLLKKKIASALIASLSIGSVPGWAQEESATATPTAEESAQRQQFRDSIDRAINRPKESEPQRATAGVAPEVPNAVGPPLTAHERQDLDKRHATLQTDPVARGAGSLILILLSVALTIGITIWAIDEYGSDDSIETASSMARR
jgi:hypothetical protein